MTKKTEVEQVKKGLRRKRSKTKPAAKMLSTGSTLLNLAMSGRVDGGWVAGHYYLFVGDSDSGKSWLMHSALAEASIDPRFDSYRLIYDNTEAKALMDVGRYFGEKLVERIEPPGTEDGEPVYSESVEDFYYHVDDALGVGRPFVYILDSQDSLTSDREAKKFAQQKRQSRGKASKADAAKGAGDFGDGKAKVHSGNIRKLIRPLERSGSILIVVNQSRDSFDLFTNESYSGGRALKFYAVCQLWSYNAGQITKTYKGKRRQLGIKCRIKVKKNHIIGKNSDVVVPILHSHGIDDVGACIDYLCGEGYWTESRGIVTATGLGPELKMKRERLVQKIESDGDADDLRSLVGTVWKEIEAACEPRRKPKYGQ